MATAPAADEKSDREAARSLSFEQFHALRNRKRAKGGGSEAAGDADGEDAGNDAPATAAAAAAAAPAEREPLRLGESIGEFVEMTEVQLVVIVLIVLDVAAVITEQFIELHALGSGAWVPRLASLLDAFTGFTIFFFLIELGLTFVAFGEAALFHVGYLVDLAVVVLALYWELNLQSKTLRLLGVLRAWRAVRLVSGLVAAAEREKDTVESQLDAARLALSKLQTETERSEQALRREVEAKQRVERQVQGYKDMNETLHEALSIAAANAAEHQLMDSADAGGAFLEELEKDGAQAASAGGQGGAAKEAPAAQNFVVKADGTYSKSKGRGKGGTATS
eukprot:g3374.t1